MNDPFASQTDTATDTKVDETFPSQGPFVEPGSGSNLIRLTLKGGSGYAAPWITIEGSNVNDALAVLRDGNALKELIDETAKVGNYFAGTEPASPNKAAPAAAQAAPSGQSETCVHGAMTFRSGVSKAGKAYSAFFCPSSDRNNQCSPVWSK